MTEPPRWATAKVMISRVFAAFVAGVEPKWVVVSGQCLKGFDGGTGYVSRGLDVERQRRGSGSGKPIRKYEQLALEIRPFSPIPVDDSDSNLNRFAGYFLRLPD